MSIKIGDLVRFRAGGPLMEVVELTNGGAQCAWFVGTERQAAWVSSIVLVNFRKEPPLKAKDPIQLLN